MTDVKFEIAPPQTRSAIVLGELRRLIQSGELAAGTRLRQGEIAAQFGVSITPVREAFVALAREGLVRHEAHRQVVVFQPRLNDLEENYRIRGALEPLAAELAAGSMTAAQVDSLAGLLSAMATEVDTNRYQDLNREFHRQIYAAAASPRLAELIDTLRDASEAYLRLNAAHVKPSDAYQRQVQAEHKAIVESLRKHDAQLARSLTEEHLRHNYQQIAASLEAAGELQVND